MLLRRKCSPARTETVVSQRESRRGPSFFLSRGCEPLRVFSGQFSEQSAQSLVAGWCWHGTSSPGLQSHSRLHGDNLLTVGPRALLLIYFIFKKAQVGSFSPGQSLWAPAASRSPDGGTDRVQVFRSAPRPWSHRGVSPSLSRASHERKRPTDLGRVQGHGPAWKARLGGVLLASPGPDVWLLSEQIEDASLRARQAGGTFHSGEKRIDYKNTPQNLLPFLMAAGGGG